MALILQAEIKQAIATPTPEVHVSAQRIYKGVFKLLDDGTHLKGDLFVRLTEDGIMVDFYATEFLHKPHKFPYTILLDVGTLLDSAE